MLGSAISAIGSLAGSLIGGSNAKAQADQDWQRQQKVLQKGIQWRVQDAKAAGIHPIYALGAPTFSYSPSNVGGDSMSQAFSDMGQNLGRAADALTSPAGRNADALASLALEREQLQNDLLRSQIALNRQAGQPPGLPAAGNPSPSLPIVQDGKVLLPPEKTSSAQDVEDRYGDLPSAGWGFYQLLKDGGAAAVRHMMESRDTMSPTQREAADIVYDFLTGSRPRASTYYKNNLGREYW